MTSDEVHFIQQLIKSEFAQRDQRFAEGNRRFAIIEDRLNAIDTQMAGIEREMIEFKEVASDLKEVAHTMAGFRDAWDPFQRFVQVVLAKKTWAILAGVIFVANWIADHVPMFVGWFS